MAELVNQRVEGMISELEQMQRIDLYTSDEIREIARKRKEFEYKVQRQQKSKEDYIRYIAYESALLEDISVRRNQMSQPEKKEDIEYAIAKRLNKLYKQLIFRFQADINVWLEYIKFCKNVGFIASVSQIIGAMLQVHGDKPKAWHLACMWECHEKQNSTLALKFLLKGLHRHPTSGLLYKEAILLQLKQAVNASEEIKELQLKRVEIICNKALESILEVGFFIDTCKVLKSYIFALPVLEKIFSKFWPEHRDEIELWEFIALCELDGLHFDDVTEFLNAEYTSEIEIPDSIRYCINIFDYALTKFEDEEVMTFYLKTLINLSIDQCSTKMKLYLLKNALYQGHDSNLLPEDWYKFWIELLSAEVSPSQDIDQILRDACTKKPLFEYLWKVRLERKQDDFEALTDILVDAKKHLKSEKSVFFWHIILENSKDLPTLLTLYGESQLLPVHISAPLRPLFLERIYQNSGIKLTRKEYIKMVKTPPLSLNIHHKMIEIELLQEKLNVKSCRQCHEYATQQFGDKDSQVWFDYMEFELNKGSPQTVGQLYNRAIASLKHQEVDKFIKIHALQKAGKTC